MKKGKIWCSLLLVATFITQLSAQLSNNPNTSFIPNYEGLKFYSGKDSSTVFQPTILSQFWAKGTRNNPGTSSLDGTQAQDWSPTFGVRRVRLLLLAEVGDRLQGFMQLGINNQPFADGGGSGTGGVGGYGQAKKPQVFVHDAWGQYRFAFRPKDAAGFPKSLYVGAGLHYYGGPSRLSGGSVPSEMLLDFPIFNFPEIERGSQFGRQFGVFAKGDIRRLHYRFAVNQPFINDGRAAAVANPNAATDYPTDNFAYTGYVEWHFGDWEATTLPFRAMTYIGSKKVLNIGAGFYTQAKGAGQVVPGTTDQFSTFNKTVLSADIFIDRPIGEMGSAITAYAVYYDYNFGPNFYRSVGLLNPASTKFAGYTGETVIDGFGNSEPLLGTGNITHLQLGYLWPSRILPGGFRLQNFAAFSNKNLERLGVPANNYDLGVNLFMRGHAAKVSAQWGLRPQIFQRDGKFESDGYRSEFIAQFQIAI